MKGETALFRESSIIEDVAVTDVTVDNREFSVTFQPAKGKGKPITISSVWSNAFFDKNGFSIHYVGSSMITTNEGVALFYEAIRKAPLEDRNFIFSVVLQGRVELLPKGDKGNADSLN